MRPWRNLPNGSHTNALEIYELTNPRRLRLAGNLSNTAKDVFGILWAWREFTPGFWETTYETIAKEVDRSPSTARVACRDLERAKFIDIDRSQARASGGLTFRINHPNGVDELRLGRDDRRPLFDQLERAESSQDTFRKPPFRPSGGGESASRANSKCSFLRKSCAGNCV